MNEKLRQRLTSWFDEPWRVVPAQPILYSYLLVAGIHVIASPANERIGFAEAGFSERLYYAWNILVIVSPIAVGIAWLCIRYRPGIVRVIGFWLRLGGDLGILAALAALIATRYMLLRGSMGDSPIFALTMLTGMTTLVLVWVVRDIGKIILLERTARRLHAVGDS